MSHHRKAKIAIAKCEKCNMIHLIVEQDQCIVASVPMTRGGMGPAHRRLWRHDVK